MRTATAATLALGAQSHYAADQRPLCLGYAYHLTNNAFDLSVLPNFRSESGITRPLFVAAENTIFWSTCETRGGAIGIFLLRCLYYRNLGDDAKDISPGRLHWFHRQANSGSYDMSSTEHNIHGQGSGAVVLQGLCFALGGPWSRA